MALVSVFLLLLFAQAFADEPSKDLVLKRVARQIDLTSHLFKQEVSLTLENAGERPLSWFLYTVDTGLASKLAYVGAEVRDEGDDPVHLSSRTPDRLNSEY